MGRVLLVCTRWFATVAAFAVAGCGWLGGNPCDGLDEAACEQHADCSPFEGRPCDEEPDVRVFVTCIERETVCDDISWQCAPESDADACVMLPRACPFGDQYCPEGWVECGEDPTADCPQP